MLRVFTALMLFVAVAAQASGFDIVCVLGNRLVGMAAGLSLQADRLRLAQGEPKAHMDKLRQGFSFIDATKDVLLMNTPADEQGSGGITNGGIYSVRLTKSGNPAVAKLVPAQSYNVRGNGNFGGTQLTHPYFKEPILIQQALADLGYAPRILGILPYRETSRWMQFHRLELPESSKGEHVTLVMEPIDRPWNVPKSRRQPAEIKGWSLERVRILVSRVKEMEWVLAKMGITADDPQLFVTPSGRAFLGDLDRYEMAKPGAPRASFNRHIDFIVKEWEGQTGQIFPPDELRALKSFWE